MIKLLLNKYRAAVANSVAQVEVADANRKIAAEMSHIVTEASNLYTDPELKYSTMLLTEDAVQPQDITEIQKNMYLQWRTNPFVHGWIEQAVAFLVGSEFHLKSVDEDPATGQIWDDYWKADRFSLRSIEITRRWLRDGEVFMRIFKLPNDDAAPDGGMTIRFLNPRYVIADPNNSEQTQFGILTDPNDFEKPVAYFYDAKRNGEPERIDAAEVIHMKRSESDFKRGVPWLLPILPLVMEIEKLLKSRQLLHRLRASCIIDQEVKSSNPQAYIQALADRQKSTAETGKSGVNAAKVKVKPMPIGGVYVHSDNIKRTFNTPNLQALDADADIRRHLLECATMMGWAEYATTADASNSNYASTMIAESPFVKSLSKEQVWLADGFERIHQARIRLAIDNSELTPTSTRTIKSLSGDSITETKETVPRPTGAIVNFPNLIHRDYLQETQALALQRTEGILSLRTMQVKLELDPEEERLNMLEEEKNPNPLQQQKLDAQQALQAQPPGGEPVGQTKTRPQQNVQAPAKNEPAAKQKTRTRPTNR